jgi:hypothetical protein
MIDFVSTRDEVDPVTRGCARMLGSLIANTVRWASFPTSQLERQTATNIREEAQYALDYLFGADSPFEMHMTLLGGSAVSFRRALLDSELADRGAAGFGPDRRHVLITRHAWWQADQQRKTRLAS